MKHVLILAQVVVYDGAGIFSAPRVWWTFRAFGHDRFALREQHFCMTLCLHRHIRMYSHRHIRNC
jgi:hypothetical protein